MSFICACRTEEQLLAVLGSITNSNFSHYLKSSVCRDSSFTATAACGYVIVTFFADLQEVANARLQVCNSIVTDGRSKVEYFRLK